MEPYKEIRAFIRRRRNKYKVVYQWIDKNTYGHIDYDKEEIVINIELIVVYVFVHEHFHEKYLYLGPFGKKYEREQEKYERMIEKKANRFTERMRVDEIKKLAKYLLKKLK